MSGKKVVEEKTEEQKFYENNLKTDTIYIRVTNDVYRKVYRIAKENDESMSEVCRLALENSLIHIEYLLKEIKALKNEYKAK